MDRNCQLLPIWTVWPRRAYIGKWRLASDKEGPPLLLFISYHQNDVNASMRPEGSRERWKDFKAPADLELSDRAGPWREESPDYLGCCHSLKWLADGREEEKRREVYMEISESHIGRAIRTEKWKYAVAHPDLAGQRENLRRIAKGYIAGIEGRDVTILPALIGPYQLQVWIHLRSLRFHLPY